MTIQLPAAPTVHDFSKFIAKTVAHVESQTRPLERYLKQNVGWEVLVGLAGLFPDRIELLRVDMQVKEEFSTDDNPLYNLHAGRCDRWMIGYGEDWDFNYGQPMEWQAWKMYLAQGMVGGDGMEALAQVEESEAVFDGVPQIPLGKDLRLYATSVIDELRAELEAKKLDGSTQGRSSMRHSRL